MGGCFSLPDRATEDPVNDQPQQPGGAMRMAKNLCQSIYDFFKECFCSRWCFGDFDSSMVNTYSYTWDIPPIDNKRSDPLGDNEQRASDMNRRTEAGLRIGANKNVVGVAGNKNTGGGITAFLSECRDWS